MNLQLPLSLSLSLSSKSYIRNKGKRVEHRAVLISGPPGIGKTTSARLVSINEGYHVVEFNASDARNKKAIEVINSLKLELLNY
jgi:replication factor C subunit 1